VPPLASGDPLRAGAPELGRHTEESSWSSATARTTSRHWAASTWR